MNYDKIIYYEDCFFAIIALIFLLIAIYDIVKILRQIRIMGHANDANNPQIKYKSGLLKIRIGEIFTIAQFETYSIFNLTHSFNFYFIIAMGILAVVFLIIGIRELYKLQSLSNIPFKKEEKILSLVCLFSSGIFLFIHVVGSIIVRIQLKSLMNM